MVVALLTVVVMVLLTAALVVASMTEVFNAQTAEDSARAFLVADAAAARAIASLRVDSNWSDNRGDCPQGYLKDQIANRCMGPDAVPYPDSGALVVKAAPGGDGTSQPPCAAVSVTPVASPSPGPQQGGSIGTYTVQVLETPPPEPGKISLRAIGRVGRAVRGFDFTVERVTPADFVSYSSLRVDATRVGNGTFRIHGSVYVRGNWEFHGNSQQLNDRPVSDSDSADPVYDNQTFVCGDLVLNGNPQIGEQSRPMLGVHIAGGVRGAGRARDIYALLQDKVVPDIRLGSVPVAVACIKGTLSTEECQNAGFGSLHAYTNELSGGQLVVLRPPSGQETSWQRDTTQTSNLTLGSQSWRIPKRGQQSACASTSLTLAQVLGPCAAYYDHSSGKLYVAAGQVIYIPGSLSVQRDTDYRVDDDPSQACNPAAGSSDPCRPGDGAMFVVACEGGTGCDPSSSSPAYGLDVREMLRAQRPASSGPFYPQTTFPSRDLLAILVHGRVRFGLSGNPANQEINAVVVSGCDTSLPPERCDLTMQKNLQLYGSVISRLLVFEQNVDLFQVPDLRRYLPFSLDQFLSAPGGAAVVVTQWREVGF
jgi:hypothetical protein